MPNRTCSFLTLAVCTTAILLAPTARGAATGEPELKLWYDHPATNWETEALPIGNGRLGAMIFGGIRHEHIQFNESSLWIGDEQDTGRLSGVRRRVHRFRRRRHFVGRMHRAARHRLPRRALPRRSTASLKQSGASSITTSRSCGSDIAPVGWSSRRMRLPRRTTCPTAIRNPGPWKPPTTPSTGRSSTDTQTNRRSPPDTSGKSTRCQTIDRTSTIASRFPTTARGPIFKSPKSSSANRAKWTRRIIAASWISTRRSILSPMKVRACRFVTWRLASHPSNVMFFRFTADKPAAAHRLGHAHRHASRQDHRGAKSTHVVGLARRLSIRRDEALRYRG